MPAPIALPADLFDELVAWARAGLPNEACGLVAGDRAAADGGRPLRFHALANAAASPYRYLIEPAEQLRVMLAVDAAGEEVWGIFHSHVASPAVPSATDIELAFYPEALYLICSLADPAAPVVRAWQIVGGEVSEVPLVDGSASAVRSQRSEAELIREGVAMVVERHAVREPTIPLFTSGLPDLAEHVDEGLEGFGEG